MEEKHIYVVFEKTTLGMGKFIRAVTKFPYNHVGISFSEDIGTIYSFSRIYKKAPFYGGFAAESPLRLKNGKRKGKIKICAVPVSEEDFSKAEKYISDLSEKRSRYIYNMVSAMLFPFKVRAEIADSFTCGEFVINMLENFTDIKSFEKSGFCSIRELSGILEPYKIYEGSGEKFLYAADWGTDTFAEKKSAFFLFEKTLENNFELLKRLIKKARFRF